MGGAANLRVWSVILHPQEQGSPSKTGEFDETLLLDNPEFVWMGAMLTLMKAKVHPSQRLVSLTYQSLAHLFQVAAMAVNLQALGPPTMYQCRHGGASHEIMTQARTIPAIKHRGRWRTDAALRRYEKGGRITQQIKKLGPLWEARAHQAFTKPPA